MCDDSYPEFLKKEKRKAKKNYFCSECGFTINSGDFYHYIAGKWDGDMRFFRRCLLCDAACESLRTALDYDGCFGGLWEEYNNFAFDGYDLPFCMLAHKDIHLGEC